MCTHNARICLCIIRRPLSGSEQLSLLNEKKKGERGFKCGKRGGRHSFVCDINVSLHLKTGPVSRDCPVYITIAHSVYRCVCARAFNTRAHVVHAPCPSRSRTTKTHATKAGTVLCLTWRNHATRSDRVTAFVLNALIKRVIR